MAIYNSEKEKTVTNVTAGIDRLIIANDKYIQFGLNTGGKKYVKVNYPTGANKLDVWGADWVPLSSSSFSSGYKEVDVSGYSYIYVSIKFNTLNFDNSSSTNIDCYNFISFHN